MLVVNGDTVGDWLDLSVFYANVGSKYVGVNLTSHCDYRRFDRRSTIVRIEDVDRVVHIGCVLAEQH